MRKIMRTVAHGIFSVRAIERPLTVALEELAAAAAFAIATSSTVAGCVARRPLPVATSRDIYTYIYIYIYISEMKTGILCRTIFVPERILELKKLSDFKYSKIIKV